VRLLVARCTVEYSGRLTTSLPEAVRLLMFKADGSFLVHADVGGYKPLNWMTPPTVIEEQPGPGGPVSIVVRKQRAEERLEVSISEVLCGEGFRLVRREWPTDIGPVDLMCRDGADEWVAVEIKRIATIESVEQLTRYLERIRRDPAMASCRGVLAAQQFKPQARVLAEARGLACAEVDLALLRGEREPELTLFAG